MSEERPGYDAGGTVEVEIPVLIDLLSKALDGLRLMRQPGCEAKLYRANDLHRRIMAGQVYVGVCDWPAEGVTNIEATVDAVLAEIERTHVLLTKELYARFVHGAETTSACHNCMGMNGIYFDESELRLTR